MLLRFSLLKSYRNCNLFFSLNIKRNVSNHSSDISYMLERRPLTASLRHRVDLVHFNVWRGSVFKNLSFGRNRRSGRDCFGHITVRHIGSFSGRLKLRCIDRSSRNFRYIPFYVCSLEYCPGINSYISLVYYLNGVFSYILASTLMESQLFFYPNKGGVSFFEGGSFLLYSLSVGCVVYNVELKPYCGGSLCRSAGMYATLIQKLHSTVWLRLPSGLVRVVSGYCMATLGTVSKDLYKYIMYGSAGRIRLLGRRPTVRGVAMNPVDHPHGGGEGRTSGGRPSVSPWSHFTKGTKTRNPRKNSSYIIVK